METSPLIWRANEWTDSYMIGTSAMKVLKGIAKYQSCSVSSRDVLRPLSTVYDEVSHRLATVNFLQS